MKFIFGALKKIGDKVSSKLNIFSSMVLQCWLNILENIIIIYYVTEKHSSWAPGFASKAIVCTTKFYLLFGRVMKHFKMENDTKIKMLTWHLEEG